MLTDLPAAPPAAADPPEYTLLHRAWAWPFKPGSPRYQRMVRQTRMLIRANAVLATVDAVAILVWSLALGGHPGADRVAQLALATGVLMFLIDYGLDHWRRP